MRTHPTSPVPVSALQLFPSATPAGTSRYAQLAAPTEGDCYTKSSNNSISHWCGCNFFHPTCALPPPCTSPRRRATAGGSCYCTVPRVLHGLSRQDGWLSSYFYFPIAFSSILYITSISIYNGGTHTHYRIHHIYAEQESLNPSQNPNLFPGGWWTSYPTPAKPKELLQRKHPRLSPTRGTKERWGDCRPGVQDSGFSLAHRWSLCTKCWSSVAAENMTSKHLHLFQHAARSPYRMHTHTYYTFSLPTSFLTKACIYVGFPPRRNSTAVPK